MLFLPIKTNKDMYIVLNKSNNKSAFIRELTELSAYINVATHTIKRALKVNERWEIGDFIIIIPDYVQLKSNRGGFREKKQEY